MADIKIKLYDLSGKSAGDAVLDSTIFGVKIKPEIVQQVVVAQQKNSREAIAHTKGRSEVRGGGRKPWKQKGTGRARHGSIRSPLWVGGGVTFGPTADRNFSVKINKKIKQQALGMVLSDKVAQEHMIVLVDYKLPEAKTKLLKKAFDLLPNKGKTTLIVTSSAKDPIVLAARNLPKISTINYGSLNVVDLLAHEYLVISQDLIKKVSEHYS